MGGIGGTIVNNGALIDDDGSQGASSIIDLANEGTVTVEAGDRLTLFGATTNNAILAAASGSLIIKGALAAAGTESGLVEIGAGQSVEFASRVASDQDVVFEPTSASGSSAATVVLDDPSQFAATLSGFASGDRIDLTGLTDTSRYEAVYFVGPTGGHA